MSGASKQNVHCNGLMIFTGKMFPLYIKSPCTYSTILSKQKIYVMMSFGNNTTRINTIGKGQHQGMAGVKTRSRAIDRLRKQKRQELNDTIEQAGISSTDPTADSVLMKLNLENLHESLRHLPEPQREALTATYFRSLRQNEWAKLTGHPLGTVKSWIRYGVKNIRKQFIQMGWLEP